MPRNRLTSVLFVAAPMFVAQDHEVSSISNAGCLAFPGSPLVVYFSIDRIHIRLSHLLGVSLSDTFDRCKPHAS